MNTITIHHQEGEFDVTVIQDQAPCRDGYMSWTFSEFDAAKDFASGYLSLMNTTDEKWQWYIGNPKIRGC